MHYELIGLGDILKSIFDKMGLNFSNCGCEYRRLKLNAIQVPILVWEESNA